jgi:peptide/nickel transport system substrate-binding protein
MRRKILAIVSALALAALIVSCAAPAAPATGGAAPAADTGAAAPSTEGVNDVPREKTLIIGFEGGPSPSPENYGLNPSSLNSQGVHQVMVESLYYLNYQDGELVPWLAAGPAEFSDDFTQVTIKLRDGIKWNDGEPMTAEDIAYTIDLLKANPTLLFADRVADVKEAKAVDDLTVQITLNTPDSRFVVNAFGVNIWGAVWIVPKHIWEGQDPNTFNNYDPAKGWPVWSGPYKLVKTSASEFVFDRRDDWWGAETGFQALPEPERVIFVDAGPDERKAAALTNNEVDGEPSLRIDTFADVVTKNPDAIGWTTEGTRAWIDPCPGMLGFNTTRAPWDDKDMRWAVNYALNKQQIGDAGSGGAGIPSAYNFPDYPALQSWLTENQDLIDQYGPLTFDPAKAKSIIESKGYTMGSDGYYAKDGKTLSAEILVKAEEVILPALLVQQFQDVGIQLIPQPLPTAAYYNARDNGEFDIESTHVSCGSVVEPYAELNTLAGRWVVPEGQHANQNPWRWQNEEYDKIVEQIQQLAPGSPEEHTLFRQALEIRLQELPIISLSQQQRVVPYTTRYWTNWPTKENDYHHPPNWWMNFMILVTNIKAAQ